MCPENYKINVQDTNAQEIIDWARSARLFVKSAEKHE